ncbi:hypothetical protein BBW65_03135 [Helicobacter enhydrae]|uniref:Uncharacterized protein n=1 Tax=Helicobacter enhydrae TaxID=222136 RepID=A0A1B1U4Z0_9HELI|nr:hypothetical protein [Helicobacter enhydrae]ANV97857.1 hypothetical protein BBW65_03135 [Helicobacter enhydrae]
MKRQTNALIFCYVFFALLTFTMLSILVSLLSTTFSQLFLIFTQNGGIFNTFVLVFYFLGFTISLYSLITSASKQHNLTFQILVLICCIGFVFAFVFTSWQPRQHLQPSDFIMQNTQTITHGVGYLLLLIFCTIAFVVLPLLSLHFHLIPNLQNRIGFFLAYARPSINTSIYFVMGIATQGYFTAYHLHYVDIFALVVSMSLLSWTFWKYPTYFGIYERLNGILLILSVILIACASKLFSHDVSNVRYSFFACGLISWCCEWMLKRHTYRPL